MAGILETRLGFLRARSATAVALKQSTAAQLAPRQEILGAQASSTSVAGAPSGSRWPHRRPSRLLTASLLL